MGNWVIYHKGTGTFFAVDSDVVAIDVSKLDDDTFERFFGGVAEEEIANAYGKALDDSVLDTLIGE